MNASFFAFAAIAAATAGWVAYNRHQTTEQEIQTLKRSRATHEERAEEHEAKLAGVLKKIQTAEARAAEAGSAPRGPTLTEVRLQGAKLRAEWREMHWKFQQRLEEERKKFKGRTVAEIRTTTGKVWPNAKVAAIEEAGIRVEHADGITRVPAAELAGQVGEFLLLGWKATLPEELEGAGSPDDSALPPLPPSAPLATLSRPEREARISLVRIRMKDLEGRISRAKEEIKREQEILHREESRIEAAVVTKIRVPEDAKARAEAAKRKVSTVNSRLIIDERQHLGLKRELQQIEAFEAKQGG